MGDRDPAGELSRTSGPTCLEVSCALALLCLVPPGGEDLALRALAAALGTSRALPATLSSVRRCIQARGSCTSDLSCSPATRVHSALARGFLTTLGI